MLNPNVITTKVPGFAAALAATHAPIDWKDVLLRTGGYVIEDGNR